MIETRCVRYPTHVRTCTIPNGWIAAVCTVESSVEDATDCLCSLLSWTGEEHHRLGTLPAVANVYSNCREYSMLRRRLGSPHPRVC